MKLFSTTLFAATLIGAGVFFIGAAKSFLLGQNSGTVSTAEDSSMAASVFFTQSVTAPQLRATFDTASNTKKKLNILIVPGHEPDFGGTEYRAIKERDLNADLALYLAQYLIEDGHYNVVMTRGKDGWNPEFQNYFTAHEEEVKTFVRSQKMEMVRLVGEGKIARVTDSVPHNDAPDGVALRLYGINKWANDNKIDIVIHVHFNDSAPRPANAPGDYNGFTIYTPDRQYSNSQATAEIAQDIFKRLSRMFPISNLSIEDKGVVEDQDLIAVGSDNSVDAASMLVEYGYIYEPQLQALSTRDSVLKESAFQTYLGLADFFGETALVAGAYESTLLPYEGNTLVKKTKKANPDVLALQAALIDKGFYPPQNYTRNDCPLSGLFGPCTQAALSSFQQKFNVRGEQGVVGAKTRAQLRALFQPNLVSTR